MRASEACGPRSIRGGGTSIFRMGLKIGKSAHGCLLHYSVGMIIERDGKYLLIDRAVKPFGFAMPAGHIEEEETPGEACVRETIEEVGVQPENIQLLYEGALENNWCSRGVGIHYWYIYKCEIKEEPKLFIVEEKSIGWYSPKEMQKMEYEFAARHWFTELGVLKK